mmetsp:Transcript_6048/g.14501  ORF Transcript_6048/g.14501 Transcript_6048/m.14501 type:complete len:320 (-) Transcript_6048:1-960(-)
MQSPVAGALAGILHRLEVVAPERLVVDRDGVGADGGSVLVGLVDRRVRGGSREGNRETTRARSLPHAGGAHRGGGGILVRARADVAVVAANATVGVPLGLEHHLEHLAGGVPLGGEEVVDLGTVHVQVLLGTARDAPDADERAKVGADGEGGREVTSGLQRREVGREGLAVHTVVDRRTHDAEGVVTTGEAGEVKVQAVVILHLELVDHERPVEGDAVGRAPHGGDGVKLDRGKPEAVGGGVIAVDYSLPRHGGRGLHAREVLLRLSAVVDHVAADGRSHADSGKRAGKRHKALGGASRLHGHVGFFRSMGMHKFRASV